MSTKMMFGFAAVFACLVALGFHRESPREQASALLAEQVQVLNQHYTDGASPSEVRGVVASFDARVAPLLAQLTETERASLAHEIEVTVAGQLWGMGQ